ncbi:D-alanyl-D-alanine carboxypeptidase [Clostridium sp. AM58-1XD]|nr:D-alanyl-D-alanine carboxypeptidase [Clostridium sp. AM58-1XD]
MAVFALFCVLLGGAAVSKEAVPAWKDVWEKAGKYETEQREEDISRDAAAGTENEERTGPDFRLYAQSAVLMDGDSGRILFGKNESDIHPMASTTKIMTCILALELGNGDDLVTVSKNAASQPQVHLGAPSGRQFYLKDLLYSLMLESHNDSAVMIAEHVGGSVEAFAGLMNQKARDLGCTDTYFITPNGLDASGTDTEGKERAHSTTAADLARIMKYCISESPKKDEFLAVTGTKAYTFSDAEGKGTYSCVNHNALLTMMDGAYSGKTGFTGGAGYCYVGALEDGEKNFIVALLGCGWPPHKTYKWADARALLQYGMKNYEYRNVWKDVEIPEITVENGIPEDGDISRGMTVQAEVAVPEKAGPEEQKNGGESLYLLLREDEQPDVRLSMKKELEAPVRRGDTAGKVEYELNGRTVAAYPVVVKEDADPITLKWCMEKIAELYLE